MSDNCVGTNRASAFSVVSVDKDLVEDFYKKLEQLKLSDGTAHQMGKELNSDFKKNGKKKSDDSKTEPVVDSANPNLDQVNIETKHDLNAMIMAWSNDIPDFYPSKRSNDAAELDHFDSEKPVEKRAKLTFELKNWSEGNRLNFSCK